MKRKKYEYKYVCGYCKAYTWRRGPNATVCWLCSKRRLKRTGERRELVKLRTYWVSWYHDPATMTPFTLHRPWWVTGEDGAGRQTICAAIRAEDEFKAWAVVRQSYDEQPKGIEVRFITEHPDGWRPPEDRFPPADWMEW